MKTLTVFLLLCATVFAVEPAEWEAANEAAMKRYEALNDPNSALTVRANELQQQALARGGALAQFAETQPQSLVFFADVAAFQLGIAPVLLAPGGGTTTELEETIQQLRKKIALQDSAMVNQGKQVVELIARLNAQPSTTRSSAVSSDDKDTQIKVLQAEVAAGADELTKIALKNQELEQRLANGSAAYKELYANYAAAMQSLNAAPAQQTRPFDYSRITNPAFRRDMDGPNVERQLEQINNHLEIMQGQNAIRAANELRNTGR